MVFGCDSDLGGGRREAEGVLNVWVGLRDVIRLTQFAGIDVTQLPLFCRCMPRSIQDWIVAFIDRIDCVVLLLGRR